MKVPDVPPHKHTQGNEAARTDLKVRVEVFFSLLQEISVHVVEGLFPWQLEDGGQVLKLKGQFRTTSQWSGNGGRADRRGAARTCSVILMWKSWKSEYRR